jgi:DNA-binding response OmpR family regulator
MVVDEDAHTVAVGDQLVDLTSIEFSLLVTFCRNPGRVLAKVQLLSEVWGFDQYSLNLVEVHVSALRRKLEAHGPRVIRTIRNVGYVLRP